MNALPFGGLYHTGDDTAILWTFLDILITDITTILNYFPLRRNKGAFRAHPQYCSRTGIPGNRPGICSFRRKDQRRPVPGHRSAENWDIDT